MKNALSNKYLQKLSIKEYTSGVNQGIWLDIQGSLSIKTTTTAVPIKLMSIPLEKGYTRSSILSETYSDWIKNAPI